MCVMAARWKMKGEIGINWKPIWVWSLKMPVIVSMCIECRCIQIIVRSMINYDYLNIRAQFYQMYVLDFGCLIHL